MIVQFAPDARVGPQVLVWAKFPLAMTLTIRSEAVPELVSVTGWDGLTVSTASSLKVKLVGEKEPFGSPLPFVDPPPVVVIPPQALSR